ncbi:hypothetical protein HYALB_00010176 [Hymenoscyphus albidus]|uniref:Nitroreductase domain-containing protein n=1 Tax=Hymenoscyphus albidus TaxID=595503 RepID=A0A9N9Q2M3_9HELO|nr:hypothetical protein HYALB_00010176 [Hymenoscyphus albidus]
MTFDVHGPDSSMSLPFGQSPVFPMFLYENETLGTRFPGPGKSPASQHPSNSNIQPWRLTIVHGKALSRLTTALVSAAYKETPKIPPLPKKFAHYRSNPGALVYGAPGYSLAHDDLEGRKRAVLKNYEFFDAPIGIVVCMDRSLGTADSLSVGMFLQSFLLALAERGVQSCVEGSIAGYPEIVRRELGIGEEMEVICGVAVGWEDEGFRGNDLRTRREEVDFTTRWVSE